MTVTSSIGNKNKVICKDKVLTSMKPQRLKVLAKTPKKSPIATAFNMLAGIAVRLQISGRIPSTVGFFGDPSLVLVFDDWIRTPRLSLRVVENRSDQFGQWSPSTLQCLAKAFNSQGKYCAVANLRG
jgi:hypothetical protein